MSLRRPAKNQPEIFEFSPSSLEEANKIVSKYPKGKQQSAVTVSYTHLTLPTSDLV